MDVLQDHNIRKSLEFIKRCFYLVEWKISKTNLALNFLLDQKQPFKSVLKVLQLQEKRFENIYEDV